MRVGDQELIVGGDIVLEVMGVSLAEPEARLRIRERTTNLREGEEMSIKVLRGGEIIELKNHFSEELLLPPEPEPARDD